MALYHTHIKSKLTPFIHRVQKKTALPLKNKLSIAVNALCIKLSNISSRYNGNNEEKVKRDINEEFENLENIIFEDSSLYQCFFEDYLSKNVKEMGVFRDQIKATCKKIQNLNFKGLTPEQVVKKISKLFESELKDDALTFAEEINNDFLDQKKEIVEARVEQWKKFRLLVDEDSTLSQLTLQQFENLVQNTPELMNTAPEDIKGLDTAHFERLAKADVISLKSSCSYEYCCRNKSTIDTSEVKEVANYAKEHNVELHLDTILESTTTEDLPYTTTYNANDLKNSFSKYLDSLNESCETISSCTFFSNLIYDPQMDPKLLETISQTDSKDLENVEHSRVNIEVPYNMTIDTPDYVYDYDKTQTVSTESTTLELNPCIWQSLGDDWYIQLLEIGKEKMPDTKFYYSETNLDKPEKAKKTFVFLNKIREYEIKKEEETGQDCTLLDGLNIQYSVKADSSTIDGMDKSIEVLSKVIETARDGFNETDEPVRISDVKVEKVTIDEHGKEIDEKTATDRQKQVYESISEVVSTYDDCISAVELAGFSDSVTIDGSQLIFDYELETTPYLFNESGEVKEELGGTEILSTFEGLSEEYKKKLKQKKLSKKLTQVTEHTS